MASWKYAKEIGYQKPQYTKVELYGPNMPENWKVGKSNIHPSDSSISIADKK